MAKEKITINNKKIISRMNLKGKQYNDMAELMGVSESTVRKASREGGYLNQIDELEQENRLKDVQIAMLKAGAAAKYRRKSQSN